MSPFLSTPGSQSIISGTFLTMSIPIFLLWLVSIPLTIHANPEQRGFGLSGTLSESISILSALTDLWLGDNKLSGKIPDMSQLKSLKTLHLENNQFEGLIPESLGKLPHLQEVYLQNNNLNGSTPQLLTDNKGIKLQVSPGNRLSL